MEKHLLLTISIGNLRKQLTEYTLFWMKNYCKKYDIEFKLVDELPQDFPSSLDIRFSKLYIIYKLLDTYDRIIFLDDSCIIHSKCPNLFEIVNEKKLGAYIESNEFDRKEDIKNITNHMELKYNNNMIMINTGVLVISKIHKNMFDLSNINIMKLRKMPTGFKDQSIICYFINKLNINIQNLSLKYNLVGSIIKDLKFNINDYFIFHFTRGCGEKRIELIKKINNILLEYEK